MIKKYFFRGKVALGHEGKVSFVARYKKKGTIYFLLWFWWLYLFPGKEIALGFWDSVASEVWSATYILMSCPTCPVLILIFNFSLQCWRVEKIQQYPHPWLHLTFFIFQFSTFAKWDSSTLSPSTWLHIILATIFQFSTLLRRDSSTSPQSTWLHLIFSSIFQFTTLERQDSSTSPQSTWLHLTVRRIISLNTNKFISRK